MKENPFEKVLYDLDIAVRKPDGVYLSIFVQTHYLRIKEALEESSLEFMRQHDVRWGG